jgi:sugar O-acyltransferase (sialic acid O-acetyltransferase NeuD family)
MLVIGAKGFAKEVLEILHQNKMLKNLYFYDDISINTEDKLFNIFPIIRHLEKAVEYFKQIDNRFVLGIGNPILRKSLSDKFEALGGEITSVISIKSDIGSYGIEIEEGSIITSGVIITSDIKIGKGVLINLNCTIGHDTIIENFVELSPGVHVSGNCRIGSYCSIGTNATILPKVKIGTNVIIAAGAVVTKDVPDNCMVAGVPAIIKKQLNPLVF